MNLSQWKSIFEIYIACVNALIYEYHIAEYSYVIIIYVQNLIYVHNRILIYMHEILIYVQVYDVSAEQSYEDHIRDFHRLKPFKIVLVYEDFKIIYESRI